MSMCENTNMMDFVKPFYRVQMANGVFGIFLPYYRDEGDLITYYFDNVDGGTHASDLGRQVGTDRPWRPVKILEHSDTYNIIKDEFDYSESPVWEEKSPAQRKQEKETALQVEQLEQTIKQAQKQLQQLKKGI